MKIKFATMLDDSEATELQELARRNERSLMAEMRLAIRAHLERSREPEKTNDYRIGLRPGLDRLRS